MNDFFTELERELHAAAGRPPRRLAWLPRAGRTGLVAAAVLAALAVALVPAIVILGSGEEPAGTPDSPGPPAGDNGEEIAGTTAAGARNARLRYLDRRGCIRHVRARYRPESGRYSFSLPSGARPMTIEAVAAQGRVLRETRLGPERPDGPVPTMATPTCEPPYMGVACSTPNSIACDRVAISVSASLFVRSVRLTVAGRPVAMARKTSVGRDGRGIFEGFIRPAGLASGSLQVAPDPRTGLWLGDPPVFAPVRLRARFADGRVATQTFTTRLSAGYG